MHNFRLFSRHYDKNDNYDPVEDNHLNDVMDSLFPTYSQRKKIEAKRKEEEKIVSSSKEERDSGHVCDSLGCCPLVIYTDTLSDARNKNGVHTHTVWPRLERLYENQTYNGGKILYLFAKRKDRDNNDVSKANKIEIKNRFMVHEFYPKNGANINDLHLFINNACLFRCQSDFQRTNWINAIIDKNFPPLDNDEHPDFKRVENINDKTMNGIEYKFSTCGIYATNNDLSSAHFISYILKLLNPCTLLFLGVLIDLL